MNSDPLSITTTAANEYLRLASIAGVPVEHVIRIVVAARCIKNIKPFEKSAKRKGTHPDAEAREFVKTGSLLVESEVRRTLRSELAPEALQALAACR